MDEITQYWLILRRQWLPASIVFATVVALTAVMTFKQKPVYESSGRILVKKSNSTSAIIGVGKDISDVASGGSGNINTQIELIRSRGVGEQTVAALKLPTNPDAVAAGLKVASVKGTDILEVSYRDTNPSEAASIINTVMAVYIKNDINAQRSEITAAREFVEKQLPIMEVAVQQAEGNLRIFKEQNKVVNIEEEAKAIAEGLASVNTNITSTQAQLAAATARSEAVQKWIGKKDLNVAIQSGLVSDSPALQKALSELKDVEEKLALERTRFQDDHPVIADLKSKEAALQAIVQGRAQQSIVDLQQIPGKINPRQSGGLEQTLLNDFSNSERERISLSKQLEALAAIEYIYRQRFNTLPKLEQQQRELERKLKASQSTYEILLSKLQEIRVTENQTAGGARIVTSALVPSSPVAPKKTQNLAIGGVLGLLLGVATALALEAGDKTIKDPEEAKKWLGYPLLGMIPVFEKIEGAKVRFGKQERTIPEVIVRNAPGSPISEAFRMLQTNLRFMSLDNQLKVIVISSSIPGEGKSTIAANLAVAMAQLGRKVLIVDADMRKPSQHEIWQIPNNEGLSSVLTGQSEFNEAKIEVLENLDILTAGVTPPNPVMLLDSSQMAVLVGQWAQSYDFVIIDSPPLTVAADTTLLCKMANGLVFVVRPGVATSSSVTSCKEMLEQSNQNVLGMVLNGVSQSRGNYYSYYYYRSKAKEGVADPQAQNNSAQRRLS